MLTSTVHKFGYDYVRPEDTSILTKTPSFFFEYSFFCRDFEFFLRVISFNIKLSIEDGEMLTDDLMRFVALETFRSGIPGTDITLRAQNENSIVFNAIN